MGESLLTLGNESDFHITADREFGGEGFGVTIWRGNHGTAVLGVIREESKAKAIATYLYEQLEPEYQAERTRQAKHIAKWESEQAKKPKPKPPKILKNAPKVRVLVCLECEALIPPDEVSDERVYECNTCGTTGTGEDGRRCEQCNKFTAKMSDTSCPECGAAMDDAEAAEAQQATNGELIKVEPVNLPAEREV